MYEPGQDTLNQKPISYDPFNSQGQQNNQNYNNQTNYNSTDRFPVNNYQNEQVPVQGIPNHPTYNQVQGNYQTNNYPTNNYPSNNYAPVPSNYQQPQPRYIPPPINNVNVTPIVVNTGGVQTERIVPNPIVIAQNQEEHARRNRIITIVSICVVAFAILFIILRFTIVFG